MNKRRFTAMLLAALMTASVITSCVEDDTAEDENKQPAVTTTDASAKDPAGDNPNSNSGTHLDPSVDIIDVIDQTFNGFTDLKEENSKGEIVYCNDGEAEPVDKLCAHKFIVSKVNPKDEKGKYVLDQMMTRIEAITMVINAFSKDPINTGRIESHKEWSAIVIDRIEKDNFPKVFKSMIGDKKTGKITEDSLDDFILFDELAVLVVFGYENYTGGRINSGKKTDPSTLTVADVRSYATGVMGILDKWIDDHSVSPRRVSLASFIAKLVESEKKWDYWKDRVAFDASVSVVDPDSDK